MDKDDDLFEEPVKLPLEDWIDLPPFAPRDIPDLLESYLEECHEAGFKEVRIIHGKGIGVQRGIVQKFLQGSPLIDSFSQAPPDSGGWGATIAILKGKR